MIAASVGRPHPDGQASSFARHEPVGTLVGGDAQCSQSRNERRDAIRFLHAKFRGAAHADLGAVSGEGRNRGQFVDQARNFFRGDVDAANPIAFDDDYAAWLSGGVAQRLDRHPRAEPAQHVDERRTAPVQTDVFEFHP